MAEVWEYNGYEIDEGLKPHDGYFKTGYYQYFFLVKKDGRRVMKFCVWAPGPYADEQAGGAERALDYLRAEGLEVVKERIDSENFENLLLRLTPEGRELVRLDDVADKQV